MKPQRVDPLTGMLNFLGAMASGNPNPYKQITTELDRITIDTALASDTNIWETGVKRLDIEGKWVIVEQYPNEEEANTSHKKWSNLMSEYPDYPLRDIDLWNLEALREE